MTDEDQCWKCRFHHPRSQDCTDAKWERIGAYIEECRRIVALSREPADPRPAEETEDA